MALIANNAVAFLSGETSESHAFLAFQDFFFKIILIFDFQTDLSLPHTGYFSHRLYPGRDSGSHTKHHDQQSVQTLAGQRDAG